MRPSRRWSEAIGLRDDTGSAALEFIFAGLLLLVPVVYLVVALGQIQGQTLGAEAGARHIARAMSTAAGPAEADERARVILATVIDEYGLEADGVDLDIRCAEGAPACPSAGATVIVTVRTAVSLPLVPPVLQLDRLATVPIEATAVQKISRFWSDG
ncbi:TadE family protein [Microbacterium sp. RD1]|uniref:TadE family protein n=1 Tax=Microbacterium sp. RD1 TaxID=3457313 RepID=UPI003FA60BEB